MLVRTGKTNDFNQIAPVYDQLAGFVFGRSLRNAQTMYLNRIPPGGRVLVLGGGTGWLLKEIFRGTAAGQIDYIETSPKMITLAKGLLTPEESKRVRFILGDEECIEEEARYDMVITFFILDLFKGPRLQKIFRRLDKALKPSGRWLFADFHETKDRWWHRILMLGMYRFFRIVSRVEGEVLPDFNSLFQEHHFTETASKSFYGDFITAKVYGKLRR